LDKLEHFQDHQRNIQQQNKDKAQPQRESKGEINSHKNKTGRNELSHRQPTSEKNKF
jgi:hypothetical protein